MSAQEPLRVPTWLWLVGTASGYLMVFAVFAAPSIPMHWLVLVGASLLLGALFVLATRRPNPSAQRQVSR